VVTWRVHDDADAPSNTASTRLDAIAQQRVPMPYTAKDNHGRHGQLGKIIDFSLTLTMASHEIHKFLDFIRKGDKDE